MKQLYERFDRLDTHLNQWLVKYSISLLRMTLGAIFFGFGMLKFFPGISPIEDLATRTTSVLSFGLVQGHTGMVLIAIIECAIGLSFLTGRFLRIGVWLMGFQMIGAMSPLVFFPGELFAGPGNAPTLAAQYIIKDIVLVAAGMVLAATWTGARIVAEPRTMRSTLRTRPARVSSTPQPALLAALHKNSETR